MITVVLTLLVAHLIADYLLQSDWIITNKKRPLAMFLHIGIVFMTALLALRGAIIPALAIAGLHLLIDLAKTFAMPNRLWAYLADQAAHVGTIVLVVWAFPETHTLWSANPQVDYALAIAAGFLVTVWAGGPAVGLLMQDFQSDQSAGLPNAGRMIGMLERGMIYVLVITGQPAAIGFLIAAKSVLRFDTASKDQKASEYVIIGTLASFGWALLASFATTALITFTSQP